MADQKPKPEIDLEAGTPDPFNLDALRLPPSFVETAGVKAVLSTVPVRKPHNQEWIRVHPGGDYRGEFAVIRLKDGGEFYLVSPAIAPLLLESSEAVPATIFTTVNRNKVVFLWPVLLPSGSRRIDTWRNSERETAEAAMARLVKVRANMSLGAYEYTITNNAASNANPTWPELSYLELLRLGFQKTGCFVENFEHPVIKDLRGE